MFTADAPGVHVMRQPGTVTVMWDCCVAKGLGLLRCEGGMFVVMKYPRYFLVESTRKES